MTDDAPHLPPPPPPRCASPLRCWFVRTPAATCAVHIPQPALPVTCLALLARWCIPHRSPRDGARPHPTLPAYPHTYATPRRTSLDSFDVVICWTLVVWVLYLLGWWHLFTHTTHVHTHTACSFHVLHYVAPSISYCDLQCSSSCVAILCPLFIAVTPHG